MLGNKFDDKDLQNSKDLLNFINTHGKFNISVKETIEFFRLLSWAQQVLTKKISENIVGDIKVHEAPVKPKPKSKK